MTDFDKLKEAMRRTGKPMSLIAKESGIVRETLYNRLKGIGAFTAAEMEGLTKSLGLTKKERDEIFFAHKVE